MCVHPKTKTKLKAKLKELTSRSNGWGYEKRKEKLAYAIRGWVSYFRLAEMRNFLKETDEWLRSRIRMCIWKCWKRTRTRLKNLQRCGIAKWQAWQWANTRKGYWRTAHSPILRRAISNENLKQAHYPTLVLFVSIGVMIAGALITQIKGRVVARKNYVTHDEL